MIATIYPLLCKRCDNRIEDGKKSPFCPPCRSIKGRSSKRKGYASEHKIEQEWGKRFGGIVRRTPRSGGFARHKGDDWGGDLIFKDNIFAWLHLQTESKHGYKSFQKDWLEQAERTAGNNYFIRWKGDNKDPLIVLPEETFLRILETLQELWKKDEQSV